ncbi:MAG: site-specific integrase [Clostridia bacterium]|nr:site-specific integrase [Clostridia bacterium]
MPSYEKSKSSGLWSVRFREISDIDGLTHNKRLSGFKTKKDAQYGYEDYITQKSITPKEEPQKEQAFSPLDMTFGELASRFFDYQKPRLKASSYYDTQKKIESKILPTLRDKKIKDITPMTILDWQSTISDYSYKYRKNLFTYLVSIYNFGEKYFDIPNVTKKVDRPRNLEGKKEMTFWSPDEFEKFITSVERPDYNILFRFLYLSGCRRGEALALTWNDIDFNTNTVKVSKNIAYKVGSGDKPYTITTPKNVGSNRTIHLPTQFFQKLKLYKSWQKENAKEQNFVFGGEDPLPPTSIERTLITTAARAGVKRIRIHDLRHSCASYLIHKGVTIVGVSHHLGHTSTKQTLDTYSHLLPDDNSMIVRALSDLSFI